MFRWLLAFALAVPALGGEPLYQLSVRMEPAARAAIMIFCATFPYQAHTESDVGGRFRFRDLRAGTYTISATIPERGEARKTVEVGPGTADSKRRVSMTLQFRESDFALLDVARLQHSVSTKQLAIPAKALREYEQAQRDLARHDADAAVRNLQHAVELAPQYSAAWNYLGTIAYQTRHYDRAEECFRTALQQDPKAYEPLVNLGGVLINTHKLDEALVYNKRAVQTRPNDPLANSQLGMAYSAVDNFDLAVKYLELARRLDPAHFSLPQLTLAEIYARHGEKREAAEALEDLLAHHPDYPRADKIRESIARLQN